MSRYEAMFTGLEGRGEAAFVPFLMLGDPTPKASLEHLRVLAAGGADAVELGIPFSDPVADGPTVQAAGSRAMASGTRPRDALEIVADFREEHPDVPIGLLVYANLVHNDTAFHAHCASAGVDSVLIADVPVRESESFIALARAAGIAPVLIAPPNASEATLRDVARRSEGYVYVVSRAGVTGSETVPGRPLPAALGVLRDAGAAPAMLGFGISTPQHVRSAVEAGCAGVISGSAVVQSAEEGAEALGRFVSEMKSATRQAAPSRH